MFLRLSQKTFCLASIAVTPGKQPYFASFRATLAGLVPLTTQQSVIYTFCMVQWLCHRETVAHDDFAVGEYHCAVRGITI
ncbi:hypothetical protein ROT99_12525 [Citrobacter freundii complex sp. 2023EL-00966]|uniref:hypothetical protein n=1 Tax=Citrobacter freundii complex sp. 2023EL-00966 TaxID=3076118 RepID=UPI0028961A01|nr:hypothetical protein [Citrobacter freundii complex sp. 2023EL-00966]MDT3753173.1 hypothetical protein [Citrobacter freundii complex sp. 2023EL-00966]